MTITPDRAPAGDQGFLKQLNRARVLDVVRRQPGLSRAEIAQEARLSKVTVGNVVTELLNDRWLDEGDLRQNGLGRPGRALYLDEHHHTLLGAEVGVHGLRVVACTLGGRVLHQHVAPHTPAPPQATARALSEQLRTLLAHPRVTHRTPLGLGVAVPGPVDHSDARVFTAPNLGPHDWRDVRFLELLRPHLPDVTGPWLLDNEAKAAAFGELFFASNDAPTSLVYVSLGTGIGSGLVSAGRPPTVLRGAHGLAGELGHTVVNPDGLPCHCGNRGCAETLASGWAIRAALGMPDDRPLHELLGRLDDPHVQHTLRRAGDTLGQLLLNTHHTFNPAELVIGGSLTRLGPTLLDPALAYFDTHRRRLQDARHTIRVRVVPDSTFLPARGAAAQVLASAIHPTGATS